MIWGEAEDKLFNSYLDPDNEGVRRERIAMKLLPKVEQQAEIILKNYFVGFLIKHDVKFLIADASSHFFVHAHSFNADYGKPFSFVQQRIKWYYQNYFNNHTLTKERYDVRDVLPDNQTSSLPFIDVYPESVVITGTTIQHLKHKKVHSVHLTVSERLSSMIMDKVDRTYERFIVELYESFEKEYTPLSFARKLRYMGFTFPNVETILKGVYTDTEGKGGVTR